MRALPPGWATDLAVLELSGSQVDDRGDHLVVRTLANPHYHWGNCLFVLDETAVEDAPRWLATFTKNFPDADWFAAGLMQRPTDGQAWTDCGIELEEEEVLATETIPRRVPRPDDYTVRQLAGADWEQSIAREIAENERTGEYDPQGHEQFVRARVATRSSLSESGLAAFFGAFMDGELVADLGIVRCGDTGRYQAVGTDARHRRKGLASHLLGVAAEWSAARGCRRWVIVTEPTNPAGRVYRRAGLVPGVSNAQAYRRPSRQAKSDV